MLLAGSLKLAVFDEVATLDRNGTVLHLCAATAGEVYRVVLLLLELHPELFVCGQVRSLGRLTALGRRVVDHAHHGSAEGRLRHPIN